MSTANSLHALATYVEIWPTTAQQPFESSHEVPPALVLSIILNATSPIPLASTYQELLRISGHGPVQCLFIINRQPLGHGWCGRAAAGRFGACFGDGEGGRDVKACAKTARAKGRCGQRPPI